MCDPMFAHGIAKVGQVEAGLGFVVRVVGEGLLSQGDQFAYPVVNAILECLHLLGDHSMALQVQAKIKRFDLIALPPITTSYG